MALNDPEAETKHYDAKDFKLSDYVPADFHKTF